MNYPSKNTSVDTLRKKQYDGDYKTRAKQLEPSSFDNFSQSPKVDYDQDNPETAQRAYNGDRHVGLESPRSLTGLDVARLALENQRLWPEQLKDVNVNEVKGTGSSTSEKEDISAPLSEVPAEIGEIKAVLNDVVKGFALRTNRQAEIAAKFTDEEIAQLRARMHSNRNSDNAEDLDTERFRPAPPSLHIETEFS